MIGILRIFYGARGTRPWLVLGCLLLAGIAEGIGLATLLPLLSLAIDDQAHKTSALGRYVDSKLKEISKAGAASTEAHLLVLTSLMLADEVIDLKDNITVLGDHVEQSAGDKEEEVLVIQAIDSLADRIDIIADRLQKA